MRIFFFAFFFGPTLTTKKFTFYCRMLFVVTETFGSMSKLVTQDLQVPLRAQTSVNLPDVAMEMLWYALKTCEAFFAKFFRKAPEECDDGNDINTDACTNACKNATCGDFIIHIVR